jgi:hypothetical protein
MRSGAKQAERSTRGEPDNPEGEEDAYEVREETMGARALAVGTVDVSREVFALGSVVQWREQSCQCRRVS